MEDATNELVPTAAITAMDLYGNTAGMDGILSAITKAAKAVPVDLSTKKGRDAIASTAHKVSRLKVLFDNMGKELVSEWKEKSKAVDAERKRLRDELDALKEDVRRPLTEYEEAEARRVDEIKQEIADIRTASGALPRLAAGGTIPSAHLRAIAEDIADRDITEEQFGEFYPEALSARETARDQLQAAIAKEEAAEAQRAELERLQKEAADRARAEREQKIREEAATRARLEAEAVARRQAEEVERQRAAELAKAREAEERQRRELEMAKEREARARLEAELAARRERERIEAERKAEEAAEQKRREDTKLRNAAIERVVYVLVRKNGLDAEKAGEIARDIADGSVPGVTLAV